MTPAEHLRAWFTPARRDLISCSALDRLAGRAEGTFARFLAGQKYVTLSYGSGLSDYYPALALVGYQLPYWYSSPTGSRSCNLCPFPALFWRV